MRCDLKKKSNWRRGQYRKQLLLLNINKDLIHRLTIVAFSSISQFRNGRTAFSNTVRLIYHWWCWIPGKVKVRTPPLLYSVRNPKLSSKKNCNKNQQWYSLINTKCLHKYPACWLNHIVCQRKYVAFCYNFILHVGCKNMSLHYHYFV